MQGSNKSQIAILMWNEKDGKNVNWLSHQGAIILARIRRCIATVVIVAGTS